MEFQGSQPSPEDRSTPPSMVHVASSTDRFGQPRGRLWLSLAAAALGVGATLVVHRSLIDRETAAADREFGLAAQVPAGLIQTECLAGLAAFDALLAFDASSIDVERHEFLRFCGEIARGKSFLRAFAWAPRVPRQAIPAHEAETRAFFANLDPKKRAFYEAHCPELPILERSLASYRVRRITRDGLLEDGASEGPDQFPLVYVYPAEDSEQLVGVDIASIQGPSGPARETIEDARRLGKVLPLGPSRLLAKSTEGPCLVFVGPSSELRPGPASPEGGPREGVFVGFYRMDAVLRRVQEEPGLPAGMKLELLHDAPASAAGIEFTSEVLLPGDVRRFLRFTPTSSYARRWSPWEPALSLALGSVFTALLVGYVLVLFRWNVHVRRQVDERTAELRDTNERLRHQVSETRRIERRLARQGRELERSNAELEEFAYIASHDLRAPLRAVTNLSEWIEEDLQDVMTEESRRHLGLLRARTRRLDKLVDDLLAYSRANRMEEQRETVDIGKLVESVVFLLGPPEGFRVEVKGPLPVTETVRTPLEQVFSNLIGNAIRHHDRKEGRIEISVQDLGDSYEFTVADDGPGIDPRFHERIFGMFVTLKPRDRVEGSGLGLALVKKLVEGRGGAVRLESGPGRGCRFRFTWPHGGRVDGGSDG